MATLGLIMLMIALGGGLVLRAYLARGDERELSAAEESYRSLVRETLARDSADMKQSAPVAPSRIEQITRILTGRGFFGSMEARDVMFWLERQLELAGRPKGWSAPEALTFTGIVWVIGTVAALASLTLDLPRWLVAVLLVVVFVYPYLKLRAMINRRQEQAKLEMPSLINDLIMGIGSSTGTLDDAIGRTVNDPMATGADRILVREFAQAFAEYRHGNRDREEALRAAADRLGVEVVSNFVDALIEGLRTGTPIKQILQSQSVQIQSIFEQDMKGFIAKKQSSFVIGLVLIFFGILILVIAPLFLRLSSVFGA